jgi:hypothetical protein
LHAWFLAQPGHWFGPATPLGLLGPAQPHGPGWAQLFKNYFKKNLWFSANFLLHFDQYCFVFLYCKDTNPVLKYLVFVKILKKIKNIFLCIRPSLSKKKLKKSYFIFIKKKVLACILALITSLLKSRELTNISKIPKKLFCFSFNIWGYDLIRKTYSRYKILLLMLERLDFTR